MPANQAANTAGKWGVKDKNARGRARVHTPVPGHDYQLSSASFTPMPQEHAVIFLCDPGFEVIDDDGNPVSPMARGGDARAGNERPKLNPGEVIANLDELTDTALRARAGQKPGGQKLKKSTPRKELIEFLLQPTSRPDVVSDTAGDSGGDDSDMDEDLAGKMLEGS